MAMEVSKLDTGEFVFSGRSFKPTEDKNTLLEPFGKQLLNYGIVLFAIPTEAQAEKFRQTMGCARVVRNDFLDKRIAIYRNEGKTLSVSEYKSTYLHKLKDEKTYLREVDKFALEAAVEAVDDAYRNFFEGRAKFPKFVSKYKPNGNAYTTKETGGNIELIKKNGVVGVKLPKIKSPVRVILPAGKTMQDILPFNARITSAVIKQDGKRYTISLKIEAVIDKIAQLADIKYGDVVAIDMGIKDFCHYGSNKTKHTVPNPRWIKLHEKRLRRFQQALSRKKYNQKTHEGSNNYYKVLEKVSKEQRKTKNQRKDFHHKLSRKIADSCKVFVCEDLNIKGMMKNRHLSKAIASVGWGQFLNFVEYKVERKGGYFIKADRWFPSSQTCHCCGYKNALVKNASVREWTCPECGTFYDRDDNAVDNLIKIGIDALRTERKVSVAA